MAATQPEARDLTLIEKGTPRDKIIARLGAPAVTTIFGSNKVEIYKFVQGFSAGARTARVFAHSTLSIATLGLWEITGTAIEGYARGTQVSLRIAYDDHDRLDWYEVLEGADVLDEKLIKAAVKPAVAASASAPASTSTGFSLQEAR